MSTPLWWITLIPGTHLKSAASQILVPRITTALSPALMGSEKDTAILGQQVPHQGHRAQQVVATLDILQQNTAAGVDLLRGAEPDRHMIHILRVLFWASSSMVLWAEAHVQLRRGKALLENSLWLSSTQQALAHMFQYLPTRDESMASQEVCLTATLPIHTKPQT